MKSFKGWFCKHCNLGNPMFRKECAHCKRPRPPRMTKRRAQAAFDRQAPNVSLKLGGDEQPWWTFNK